MYLIGVFFCGTGAVCYFKVENFGLMPMLSMVFAGILLIALGFVIDRLDDIKDLLKKQNRLLAPPKDKKEEKDDD